MPITENKEIFNGMYRIKYDDKEYYFEEILKKAILKTVTNDTLKAETMAGNKVNRLWNQCQQQHMEDISNGITPYLLLLMDTNEK